MWILNWSLIKKKIPANIAYFKRAREWWRSSLRYLEFSNHCSTVKTNSSSNFITVVTDQLLTRINQCDKNQCRWIWNNRSMSCSIWQSTISPSRILTKSVFNYKNRYIQVLKCSSSVWQQVYWYWAANLICPFFKRFFLWCHWQYQLFNTQISNKKKNMLFSQLLTANNLKLCKDK